jgi:hypothetical protein
MALQSKYSQNSRKYWIYVHRKDSCKALTEETPPLRIILAANSYPHQHYQHSLGWKAGLFIFVHPSYSSYCRISNKIGRRKSCQN